MRYLCLISLILAIAYSLPKYLIEDKQLNVAIAQQELIKKQLETKILEQQLLKGMLKLENTEKQSVAPNTYKF
jgi:hypothetical protein